MRLIELGIALIIAAVAIPIITVLALIPTLATSAQGNVGIGGIVLIFPIPIAITFGNNPQIIQPLTWAAYTIFLALLAITIATLLTQYRAARRRRRELT